MTDEKSATNGIDLISVSVFATLILVILRLLEIITWSWWWVFSPVLVIGGFISVIFIAFVIAGLRREFNRK